MKTDIVRAVLYARFSPRPDAKTCYSCEAQLQAGREYCRARGWQVVAEYRDDDASGGDFDREGLWDAIEALVRGMILVVEKPERLARSVYLDEWIRDEVESRGARIESMLQQTDDTPEGVLVRQILAAVAEYRRKADAQLTRARSRRHQANGKRVCGTKELPFGWSLDVDGPTIISRLDGVARPARMLPVPEELEIIERIRAMAAAGKGSRAIVRQLQTDGVLCRGRKTWNRGLIERIIRRAPVSEPTSATSA